MNCNHLAFYCFRLLIWFIFPIHANDGLPLFYWQQKEYVNFGDYLSVKIVERIIQDPIRICQENEKPAKKILALGSLLYFANTGDVLWGTGCNYKFTEKEDYKFTSLDVRAVRGPLTQSFLKELGINCPSIYGDPALLFPYLFPEYKRKKYPSQPYIIIPHLYDRNLFSLSSHIIKPTRPWKEVILAILDSDFVISGSLHGLIIAESYGIPARYLRISENEPLFKYLDYYLATGRENFRYATTIQEALQMGGEPPIQFDPKPLWNAFPFEFWPNAKFTKPNF